MAAGDYLNMMRYFGPMAILLLWFFLFCHFGDRITHRFNDVADALYELTWHKLPLDQQKMLIMMIAFGQKSVYLRGFGDTRCTHEAFIKVCLHLKFNPAFLVLNFLSKFY